METIASTPQYATLEAVVYPVCVCGCSYPDHLDTVPEGTISCSAGYRPSRPIEDHGIIWRKDGK